MFGCRYKKTSETLSQAGQKASAAFSSVGSVITKKLEDVKYVYTFSLAHPVVVTSLTGAGITVGPCLWVRALLGPLLL